MYTCVAYDISSNRTRLRASKGCKKIGLLRIQKSVFAGKTSKAQLQELESEIRELLRPKDSLVIIPLDKPSFLELVKQSNNARLAELQKPFMLFEL